jgi:hypothetical protein
VVAGGGMAAYKGHARHEAQRAMASRPALAGLLSRQPRPTDAAPAQAPEPSAAALAATPSRAARSAPTCHPAPARRHAPPQAASGATPDEAAERAPAPTAPRRAPLAGEIALLDAAERAERRHDHAAALASLDAYARTFPDGALLAEAQVLRVSALLGLGDDAAAQAEARSFLARYAPSPLAARVQSMLSQRSRREKEPR